MKSVSAILVALKKDLIVDEIEIPKIEFGKVLVEIKATRICGSQLGEIDGIKGKDRYLPHLLGHEAGGIAREIGKGVTRIKEGDHVVCHWRPASGLVGTCPIYQWKGKKVNAGPITTFGQYSIISENRLTVIDPKYSHEVSALMADTITTGFGIISNDASVRIGQSVCIIGVGGIGLGTVLGAKLAGAYPIIAVDLHDHKLKLAQKYGATHSINSRKKNLIKELSKIMKQNKVDVMIDGTGNPQIIENAYDLTATSGTCILFGVMKHDQRINIHTLPLHFGKTLVGTEGGNSIPEQDIPRYLSMIDAGLYNLDNFISHRCKIEEINSAINTMRAGESAHTIINF